MMKIDSTTRTIGLVTPPKIGGRKKSFTPGATNSPAASTIVVTVFLPVLPAGVHSTGGIVTIWTERTLRTASAYERHPTLPGVPSCANRTSR
ncbi:hypothetical protein GCM10018963_35870 [Saccharothrix longispora]